MNDKWKDVDRVAETRRQNNRSDGRPAEESSFPIKPRTNVSKVTHGTPGGAAPEKVGLRGRFEIGQTARKANVEAWKEAYRHKLDVWKTNIKTEADLAKQEILLAYNGELERINQDHITQLQQIGVSNFQQRAEAIRQLGIRAADVLQKCSQDDVPQMIRDKNIDAIMSMYDRLFEQMSNERIADDLEDAGSA